MILKKILVLGFLFLIAGESNAAFCSHKHNRSQNRSSITDNYRSDSIDVLNYRIELDIKDYTTYSINGNCEIDFTAKVNGITTLPLDLLTMNIDSVKYNGAPASFSYNDTLLNVDLPVAMNPGDTSSVIVYYNGIPQMDPSGWGGWYHQGNYIFNLGVGFESLPHNYGRVWHPCFDNFVEHATYDFIITSSGGRKAYCNGYFVNEIINGTDITRTWRMDDPIPSYLASVAVAPYTHVNWLYTSTLTGFSTPVYLISLPADTASFKNSFVNIFSAMEAFETGYGPHYWNKVGFVAVPFGSGAMEHATNIAFPLIVIQSGSLQYETLMAHELAHHWWGDLVTCRSAEHMWINEGMASYSEKLFLEYVYGAASYFNEVRANHKNVLWKAHVDDGAFYAIGAVPESVTYGTHSYDKGADVAHTLRAYLGDSLFFAGLKYVIANNQLQNIDSYDFRDQLTAATGIDLTDFFENWVMSPGFPHFSADSMSVVQNGSNYDVTLYVKQKLRSAPAYYTGVPLTVTFRDADWNVHNEKITVSGANSSFNFSLPVNPVYVALNEDEKISDAVTGDNVVITTTGLKLLSHSNIQLTISSVADSAFLRVEHNWVGADDFTGANFEYAISPDRYWRLHGVDADNFTASAKISFNGTTNGAGYLDNGLMTDYGPVLFHEDSLVVLYRPDPSVNWSVYPYFTIQTQASKTDKVGAVVIDSLQMGDYAFGFRKSALEIPDNNVKNKKIKIYPNPAKKEFKIADLPEGRNYRMELRDMNGRVVQQFGMITENSVISLDDISAGSYHVFITDGKNYVASSIVVVN